ncbi:MAG: D-alanine--D-alanine ligase [Chromatiales bacterium]|nr:D-alanine--D-alanine ligase [Chromatiales bacterium]
MKTPANIAPAQFGRVAVLAGGDSSERAISLISGAAVHAALQRRGVDARLVDPADGGWAPISRATFERVFIVLHGRGGEDGSAQGYLERVGLPYTGSGVLGSALGMDKTRTKWVWNALGLPTPAFRHYHAGSAEHPDLPLPVVVKPAREGSSLGVTIVREAGELRAALAAAVALDDEVLVERYIQGAEYTVAILDGEALPAIGLRTSHTFYDYDAKYRANDTQYLCPCGLSAADEAAIQKLALSAFTAVDCRGWGRVDLMYDGDGPWLLEVNTVPGMTDHSLVPMAARAAGIDFDSLVWRILAQTLDAEVAHGA